MKSMRVYRDTLVLILLVIISFVQCEYYSPVIYAQPDNSANKPASPVKTDAGQAAIQSLIIGDWTDSAGTAEDGMLIINGEYNQRFFPD